MRPRGVRPKFTLSEPPSLRAVGQLPQKNQRKNIMGSAASLPCGTNMARASPPTGAHTSGTPLPKRPGAVQRPFPHTRCSGEGRPGRWLLREPWHRPAAGRPHRRLRLQPLRRARSGRLWRHWRTSRRSCSASFRRLAASEAAALSSEGSEIMEGSTQRFTAVGDMRSTSCFRS